MAGERIRYGGRYSFLDRLLLSMSIQIRRRCARYIATDFSGGIVQS